MKTLEQVAEETKWLDEAKEYAKLKGFNSLSFEDEDFWLKFKIHYDLKPKEAVDFYINDF